MAYDRQTFKLVADFGISHFIDSASSGVEAADGYETAIPALWAGNEFELILECYEDRREATPTESDFGAAATTQLFIQRADSDEEPTTLATGTVTQFPSLRYGILTYSVAKDAVSDIYVGQTCIIFGEVLDGATEQRNWAQFLAVFDEKGTSAATLTAKDVTASIETLTAVVTLTAYRGKITYLIDTTLGPFTITLPSASAFTSQMIEFIYVTGAATASVAGVVNGFAGPFTLDPSYESAHLISDGTDWFNMNYTTFI